MQVLHTLFPKWFLARKPLEDAEKELLTVRLHNRLAYAYWFGRGKIPCLWAHLRGMNLAERYPPTLELAHAYAIHAPVMSLLALVQSRDHLCAEVVSPFTRSLGDLQGQGQSLHYNGFVLYVAARYEECIEKCREAVRLLERTGDFWEENIARYHIATSHLSVGRPLSRCRRGQTHLSIRPRDRRHPGLGIAFDLLVRATGGQVSAEDVARPNFSASGTMFREPPR